MLKSGMHIGSHGYEHNWLSSLNEVEQKIQINKSLDFLKQISFIAVFPAIGFLYFYFTDTRRVGREAQGPIWWNKLRPIHAFMYLLFASYAFKKEKFAWMVLFVDACLGFLFWFMHYKLGFVF